MKRRLMVHLILTLLSFLLLISCGPQKEPVNTGVQEKAPILGTDKLGVAGEGEWDRTLWQAKREGRVVVYSTVGGKANDDLIRGFRDKYGLAAEFLSGRGAEISQKLLMERKAGLYLSDVYAGGVTTLINDLKPAGALDPLYPALILPEAKEGNNWYGGNLLWMDKEQKYFVAFTAYITFDLAVNTDLVVEREITSWKDLLNQKWKGKIIINDPTTAGAGLGWFARTVEVLGVDYMKELAKNEPAIIRDQRQQVEWLARGKYALLVNPQPDPMADFIKAGTPVRWSKGVKDAAVLTSGSGHIALINKAAHPNTAKVFINWLMSREGQTIYSRAMLVQSARVDIPTEHLEDVRQPGIKYIMQTEDFYLKRPVHAQLAKDIFGPLMK